MRDFQLGWFETMQPLGRALTSHRTDADCAKTRAIIDLHNARYDFEHIDHDEPAVAPPAQPADHAARAFKVGDLVRVHGKHTGTIRGFNPGFGDLLIAMDGNPGYCVNPEGLAPFLADADCLELITPNTVEDGWVKWGGGEPPPFARVHVKFADGDEDEGEPRDWYWSCWRHDTLAGCPVAPCDFIVAYRIAA